MKYKLREAITTPEPSAGAIPNALTTFGVICPLVRIMDVPMN